VQLGVYNLFDTQANSFAYYLPRLPVEPEEGVPVLQVHPLEPESAVLKNILLDL
jgi:hypothetical protein